ncbi:MAG: (2Fe-2S)-binding protein [Lachnospiraceae bacterium]|nr:(2Fe-2S)-binding protein [Lachnospiraceae bacterium]
MIKLTIDGKEYSFDKDPTIRLLDILREDLNKTGVKEGCGEGECGACSVLINGRLTNSCLVAAGSVMGEEIITIEGLRETEAFKVLDQAFADAGAVQCGFCIPGMIMAGHALLLQNPHPTEAEVRRGISGNLCRCTGYNTIVRAIFLAAERGDGVW